MFGLSIRFTRIYKSILIVLFMLSTVGCAGMASTKYENEAAPVAEKFLARLDNGDYRGAFESTLSQMTSDSDKFLLWMSDHRTPMGKVKKRIVWGVMSRWDIPGKPDGEYLDVRYRTEFENKMNSFEGVLLRKIDGAWLVVSYELR